MQTISADSAEMAQLAGSLAKGRKVAWIIGAGCSTAAAIPDFRSAESGLFASLKQQNPDLKIASGKELFHASLFQRQDTTRAFYMMCAQLKALADAAEPTAVHRLMKEMEQAGKLFRVYTQNIDALEAKAGLTYGLGEWTTSQASTSKTATSPKKKSSKPATAKSPSKLTKGKGRAIEPATETSDGAHAFSSASNSSSAIHTGTSTPVELFGLPQTSGSSSSLASSETVHIPDSQEDQESSARNVDPVHSGLENLSIQPEKAEKDGPGPPAAAATMASQRENQTDLPRSSYPASTTGAGFDRQADDQTSEQIIPETQEHVGDSSMAIGDISRASTSTEFDVEALLSQPQPTMSQTSLADSEMAVAPTSSQSTSELPQSSSIADCASSQPLPVLSQTPTISSVQQSPTPAAPSQAGTSAAPSRRNLTIPQCIPLHGTLEELHCPKCGHIEATSAHLHTLAAGSTLYCPACLALNAARAQAGDRARGVGVMKVSVVLYGEEHASAARVGEITSRDLIKSARPDFLIVAGTTLKIPGVKKLVRELSRLVKQLNQYETPVLDEQGEPIEGKWTTHTTHTPRVIFVNRDPPLPEKAWENIFDYHITGDVQAFAEQVRAAMQGLPRTVPKALQQSTLSGFYSSSSGKAGARSSKVVRKSNSVIPTAHDIIAEALKASEPKPSVPKPKVRKEKHQPGWKGYVIAPVGEPAKADYWSTEPLPEGTSRRRTLPATVQAPSATPGPSRKPSSPKKVSARIPYNRPAKVRPPISGLPTAVQLSDAREKCLAALRRESTFPLVMEVSSLTSTPPSLASDVSTASDDGEDALRESGADQAELVRAVTISSSASGSGSGSEDIVPDSMELFPDAKNGIQCPSSGTVIISDSQPSQPPPAQAFMGAFDLPSSSSTPVDARKPEYYTPVPSVDGSVDGDLHRFQPFFVSSPKASPVRQAPENASASAPVTLGKRARPAKTYVDPNESDSDIGEDRLPPIKRHKQQELPQRRQTLGGSFSAVKKANRAQAQAKNRRKSMR